jgi:hypothetical protein
MVRYNFEDTRTKPLQRSSRDVLPAALRGVEGVADFVLNARRNDFNARSESPSQTTGFRGASDRSDDYAIFGMAPVLGVKS